MITEEDKFMKVTEAGKVIFFNDGNANYVVTEVTGGNRKIVNMIKGADDINALLRAVKEANIKCFFSAVNYILDEAFGNTDTEDDYDEWDDEDD